MEVTAVYAGTFDPVTYGHIDLIERGRKIFDKLILAVAESNHKETLFTLEERVEILKEVVKDMPGVEVEQFSGLLVDYMRNRGARVVLRGLRAISDFEHEFQIALTNRKLDREIATIFMMPKEEYSYISSSILKEVVRLGGDVREFVPSFVQKKLEGKLRSKDL
jgi:pantetheine-phosphate adenylyltransferase